MDMISSREFYSLYSNTQEIYQKNSMISLVSNAANRPKVIEKNGDTIIKFFYSNKKKLSSDKIKPRYQRFCENIQLLQKYGYAVPHLLKTQSCSDLKVHIVHYLKIEGREVRNTTQNGDLTSIPGIAKLLADLHAKGIFFRSIHLGNLLQKADGELALIDIADVRFKSSPLSLSVRYRNLKHLFKHREDKQAWQAFGINNFMQIYFEAAKLSKFSQKLLGLFIRRFEKLHADTHLRA
jgi:hypothetical protein